LIRRKGADLEWVCPFSDVHETAFYSIEFDKVYTLIYTIV